ncbi:MAG: Hint domain-containing protein [Acetobacteraceae bacterium]
MASSFSWNAVNGDWSVGSNWTDLSGPTAGPPTAADLATISNAGTITGSGTAGELQLFGNGSYTLQNLALTLAGVATPFGPTSLLFGNNGTVTVDGGSIDASAAGMSLSNNGTLIAKGGATITALTAGIGTSPGSAVNIIVTDENTLWRNLGTGGASSFINGSATLTVTNKASLENAGGFLVASAATDNATLKVSAQGSFTTAGLTVGAPLDARGRVNVDGGTIESTANLQIGNNGIGELTLTNGGLVETAGTLNVVGNNAGSGGSLLIGGGSKLRFTAAQQTNNAVLFIGRNGSTAAEAGASGSAVVTGAGSLLDTQGNALAIGNNAGAVGSLLVEQGGSIDVGSADANALYALALANGGGNGSLTLTDNGTHGTVDGFLLVGRGGSAALLVQNQATLDINNAGTNGGGITIGSGRGAGPSAPANVGGNGVANVTLGGVLDASDSTSGVLVGGNGVSGALTVTNGGTVLTSALTVATVTVANGTLYGGTGELTIGAGGVVKGTSLPQSSGYSFVIGGANSSIGGPSNAASGVVNINGIGALFDTGNNGLAIGLTSNGSMSVSQGASVVVGSPNSNQLSALALGRLGNGSLVVADAGSSVISNGGAYVGRGGTGSLTIENRGTVQILDDAGGASYLSIGNSGLVNGNTLLSGGTGSVFVTSGGYLFSQETVTVGQGGNDGHLTVSNGGTVEAHEHLTLGTTIVLPGGGSLITTTGTTKVAAATPMTASGFVTVGPGGLLKIDATTPSADASLTIGAGTGSSGILTVAGAGAQVQNAGVMLVGKGGLGNLTIRDGGILVTAAGAVASVVGAEIASDAGSDGSSVTVTGDTSTWDVSGQLWVGDRSAGSLIITAGGDVVADSGDLGVAAGGSGIVSVSGVGSSLTLDGTLQVGDASHAELSILDGGLVTAGNVDVGATATGTGNVDIEGAGSHLKIAGDLNIGITGVGVLTLGADTELTIGKNLNIGAQGVLNSFGGVIDPERLTVQSGGQFSVLKTTTTEYTVGVFNSGTVSVANGAFTLITPMITSNGADETGVLSIKNKGTLVVNAGTVDPTQSVFFSDKTGVLSIGTLAGFNATIENFITGDDIIVQGTSIASVSFDSETHLLTLFDGGSATIGALQFGEFVNGKNLVPDGAGGIGTAPCFLAGTRIATERGEVAVEDLRVGERVQVVLGGQQSEPVVWLGHRTVDCTRHPEPHKVWPVRVAAGAFGPGRPCRDLWLSPDHAVYIGDVLIPVKCLINGGSIAQVAKDEVTYYHVELPRHAVLLAEGLAAESYLDVGDRSNFANGEGAVALYPDFASRAWEAAGCAPLVVTGPALQAARRWVAGVRHHHKRAA